MYILELQWATGTYREISKNLYSVTDQNICRWIQQG